MNIIQNESSNEPSDIDSKPASVRKQTPMHTQVHINDSDLDSDEDGASLSSKEEIYC
jgi:hypothetical protein